MCRSLEVMCWRKLTSANHKGASSVYLLAIIPRDRGFWRAAAIVK